YYTGKEYADELYNKLKNNSSVYPTYLGTAYALTFPRLVGYFKNTEIVNGEIDMKTPSVVPVPSIKELIFEDNHHYNRAGGFIRDYLGERQFAKSISYIYEKDMKNIKFSFLPDSEGCTAINIEGEFICLV
ncbi:MAG TPA: hypothetical protein VFC70_03665, partial [Oscillospiraceae bacterium]|nr:hypothetical protein [Oscillospiraceae bacterium]